MCRSNVINVNFNGKPALEVRYPYIVAWCQQGGHSKFALRAMLGQAKKDRPGRYALYPIPNKKGKDKWRLLHDYADQETREVLMDLVSLKGIEP